MRKKCTYCGTGWGWLRDRFPSCANRFCVVNYRVLRSFRYKGEAKKEEPTVHRWKNHNKTSIQSSWWSGSAVKKNWKHFTRHKHRAWERDMLRKERFDQFHRRSYKNIENLWNWD